MQLKSDPHVFVGLQRDLSISKQKPEFLYDARNIRFTARENNTLMAITNEKGTTKLNEVNITGKYLGHCVINKYVVIFTHLDSDDSTVEKDRIYRVLLNNNEIDTILLYEGNLNFSTPIETLGVFEKDDVQKVYWIDDNNQPRVINIAEPDKIIDGLDTQFDFIQELKLQEKVTVNRIDNDGMFAPGVIQYAFSYYKLYGQQTNIFYTTPLHYICFNGERAGSPEEKIPNTFKIDIEHVDTDFEYLRIYSIHRTSLDAVPEVKRIADLQTSTATLVGENNYKLTFLDSGMVGDIVDPTELLYVGGDNIIAKCMTSKDNHLFFGNIKLQRKYIDESIKNHIKSPISLSTISIDSNAEAGRETKYYDFYTNYEATPGFKTGEHYRLGIQFQHKNGRWSEPLVLGNADYIVPKESRVLLDQTKKLVITGSLDISEYLNELTNDGYLKYREICVYPKFSDRLVIAQGILNPTVYNSEERKDGNPFSYSSWFFRPTVPGELEDATGNFYEFRHNHQLTGEIQTQYEFTPPTQPGDYTQDYYVESYNPNSTQLSSEPARTYVDQSIITMHSPDIEFGNELESITSAKWNLRLVGYANLGANISKCKVQLSSPNALGVDGLPRKYDTFGKPKYSVDSAERPNFTWTDGKIVIDNGDYVLEINAANPLGNSYAIYDYKLYPWSRTGSLNNDVVRPVGKGEQTAILKNKKISSLKFFHNNSYGYHVNENTINPIEIELPINDVSLFSGEELSLLKIPYRDDVDELHTVSYYGNVDTVVAREMANVKLKDDSVAGFPGGTILASSRIKYKSSKHFVFSLLKDVAGRTTILPSSKAIPGDLPLPFWFGEGFVGSDTLYEETGGKKYKVKLLHYYGTENPETFIANNSSLLTSDNIGKAVYLHDTVENGVRVYIMYTIVPGYAQATNKMIRYHGGYDEIYLYYPPGQNGNCIAYHHKYGFGSEYFTGGWPEDYTGPTNFIQTNIAETSNHIHIPTFVTDEHEYPYLLLGEIYRDPNEEIDFGGRTEDAYLANLWFPAGEPKNIQATLNLEYIYGDTWYQRYDCLKTYPFTNEDENSVIEIGSFLCETRENLDGRYDKNRALYDNTNINNTNFNKINPVYSQKNSYFNYRILHDRFYKTDKFPNQILWSMEKTLAQDIDAWTKVTLANVLDVDGEYGQINALNTFNDEIFYFQDKAFGKVLFNPRVLINSADGVPIEIGNSKKMEGKRLVSDRAGCTNKWSVCNTSRGMFFIDSNNRALYSYSDRLNSVSDTLMMDNWFKYKPLFDTERTYYDSIHQDLYLIWDDECLVFNDIMGKFTSFMDYGGTVALFPINNTMYALRSNNTSVTTYSMFTGSYNNFFGSLKDYWLEFISNADNPRDKIFSTIDIKVDFRDGTTNNVIHNEFFDSIKVENEYQNTGERTVTKSLKAFGAVAKKKFRIWRIDIPRDANRKFDRIRNTWTSIKLKKKGTDNKKMELHDITVNYLI